MSETSIDPTVTKKFILKNIKKLIQMRRANGGTGKYFVNSTKRLKAPIIPSFEGSKHNQPMDEGMIYIMFNSEGDDSSVMNIDTVWRVFWLFSPDLKFHQIETYLISEKLGFRKWMRFYPDSILNNSSKQRFHQDIEIDIIKMLMDGKWGETYLFHFDDKGAKLSGELTYQPIDPKATLVYYNDRTVLGPTIYQRFFDTFGLKASGKLKLDGKEITLNNGRGIFEHGIGIFALFNIYEWRWMNIQFDNGALHIFHHPLTIGEEVISAGEGASTINNQWNHYIHGDYEIKELEYETTDKITSKVPVRWNVVTKNGDGIEILNLQVTQTMYHPWLNEVAGDSYFIINYILHAKGTFMGEPIQGKGTMEYLMRRTIE
ncbi:MAG: hypothetical protein OEZ01_08265 [Candidatus Heimdallarchaeota archaeon]|nr:hypothetical protein [Candidatus Heimdallarchaeota archaeon]MDH5645987.1 hypothetical protein [Candidatus Heimdallarchaeota archaeon]